MSLLLSLMLLLLLVEPEAERKLPFCAASLPSTHTTGPNSRATMQRAQCALAVVTAVLSSFEWLNSSGLAAYAAGASAVAWQISKDDDGDDEDKDEDDEDEIEGMMNATGPEVDAEIELCKCLPRTRLLREMRKALGNVKRASTAVATAVPRYEHAVRDAIWNASLQGVKQRVNGVAGALQSALEMEQVSVGEQ